MSEVKIPEGALAVARAVAEAMSENAYHYECWRYHSACYRFGDGQMCPIGFLPEATEAVPEKSWQIDGIFTDDEMEYFYEWWDGLKDEAGLKSALHAIAELRAVA